MMAVMGVALTFVIVWIVKEWLPCWGLIAMCFMCAELGWHISTEGNPRKNGLGGDLHI